MGRRKASGSITKNQQQSGDEDKASAAVKNAISGLAKGVRRGLESTLPDKESSDEDEEEESGDGDGEDGSDEDGEDDEERGEEEASGEEDDENEDDDEEDEECGEEEDDEDDEEDDEAKEEDDEDEEDLLSEEAFRERKATAYLCPSCGTSLRSLGHSVFTPIQVSEESMLTHDNRQRCRATAPGRSATCKTGER
jgi:hypothetical protein